MTYRWPGSTRGWSISAIFLRLPVSPSWNCQPMALYSQVSTAGRCALGRDHSTLSTVRATARPTVPSSRPTSCWVGAISFSLVAETTRMCSA
ncbi:hypothetical protein [Streptomyces sp. MK37H]|uniref:hypothetical protein n=1 Tax=Streptomyces sp. MK37H TaxID=2699117 RepID=UPI001FF83905|nr:hypothetical protein [Streptomyces sp. MK37H]